MPAFHVSRSIVIDCSPENASAVVRDFGTWTTWSPWLPADPDAIVTLSDDPSRIGSHYTWEGDLVGKGRMEHLEFDDSQTIRQRLDFIKPWKSTSTVTWHFEPVNEGTGGGTKVTWVMDGSLPWFMFWMKGMMQGFISMDYDRGLLNLKDLIETGSIPSRTEVKGVQPIDGIRVFGHSDKCSLAELSKRMEQSFQVAQKAFDEAGLGRDRDMISVYTKLEPAKGIFHYISGYVVEAGDHCPAGLQEWSVAECNAYVVAHHGSYRHLGNAWSIANQHVRYKKLKMQKGGDFEIYRTTPDQVSETDVLTEIYLPLKG